MRYSIVMHTDYAHHCWEFSFWFSCRYRFVNRCIIFIVLPILHYHDLILQWWYIYCAHFELYCNTKIKYIMIATHDDNFKLFILNMTHRANCDRVLKDIVMSIPRYLLWDDDACESYFFDRFYSFITIQRYVRRWYNFFAHRICCCLQCIQ